MLVAGLVVLSAGTLALEVLLTRVMALTQWHHTAFMLISGALLGFGASGSLLAALARGRAIHLSLPAVRRRDGADAGGTATCDDGAAAWHAPLWLLPAGAVGFSVGAIAAYAALALMPFDSFRLAVEPRQAAYLSLQYLAAALPFTCAGLVVALLLASQAERAGILYAANLLGAAAGSLLPLALVPALGLTGAALAVAALGIAAAACFMVAGRPRASLAGGALIAVAGILLIPALRILPEPAWLAPRMSPYKALSQALRLPDARLGVTLWDAAVRVDVVESASIRSAPGLSLAYDGPLARQWGLTVDGDNLVPLTSAAGALPSPPAPSAEAGEAEHAGGPASSLLAAFLEALPGALAYELVDPVTSAPDRTTPTVSLAAPAPSPRPPAPSTGLRVLVLEAHTGLDVLLALRYGATAVDAVVADAAVLAALRGPYAAFTGGLFAGEVPGVRAAAANPRHAARAAAAAGRQYDVVVVALADSFRPVNAGTYSLTESYLYTVEAFADYWRLLAPGGVLAVQRWLQVPPSESVRLAALAAAALRREGIAAPERHLAAIRSWSTVLLIARRSPFGAEDLRRAQRFVDRQRFDFIWFGGLPGVDVNRYNVLPRPYDAEAFTQLLVTAPGKQPVTQLPGYRFDVTPPTDDRPFFHHFFRWQQIPAVLQAARHTWQPFGGGGYLFLLGLLALAMLASALFILLPLVWVRGTWTGTRATQGRRDTGTEGRSAAAAVAWLGYFGAIGLGFMFLEMPLLQKAILILDRPAYALAGTLAALLLASGGGSALAGHVPRRWGPAYAAAAVATMVVVLVLVLDRGAELALALPFAGRAAALAVAAAPLGVLLGLPLPVAVQALHRRGRAALIPWAWAANGSASVVAAILATVLALAWGLRLVLLLGAAAYLLAALAAAIHLSRPAPVNGTKATSPRLRERS